MTETSTSNTTQAENVDKTIPLALLALANHMVDHELSSPLGISLPNLGRGDSLEVHVFHDDLQLWMSTLDLDPTTEPRSEIREAHDMLANYIPCLLPDSGIRVTVLHLTSLPKLQSVPA